MKSKLKKKRLLAVVMSVMVFAGCASTNTTRDNEPVSIAQTEVATETPTATPVPETQEPVAENDGTVHFYIVRHGKTMLNTTDRVQGWSDAVLTPKGEETVENAAKGMKEKGLEFDVAYSSDSGRSIQTANIILDVIGQNDLNLKTDSRFREFNFGTYEGDLNHTMWTDIATSQGKTLEEWMETMTPRNFADSVAELDQGRDPEGLNWPAEDYDTIVARLKEGLEDVAQEVSADGGGNVLLVSHGLSIGAMISMLDEDFLMPQSGFKNASVTTVDYKDGEYTLIEAGDTSYIEIGEAQQ